jgi:hypothetical protein
LPISTTSAVARISLVDHPVEIPQRGGVQAGTRRSDRVSRHAFGAQRAAVGEVHGARPRLKPIEVQRGDYRRSNRSTEQSGSCPRVIRRYCGVKSAAASIGAEGIRGRELRLWRRGELGRCSAAVRPRWERTPAGYVVDGRRSLAFSRSSHSWRSSPCRRPDG